MSLLTGLPYGHWGPGGYAPDSVLGRVQTTLQRFRQACELLASHRSPAPIALGPVIDGAGSACMWMGSSTGLKVMILMFLRIFYLACAGLSW
jgi:hypothetical protein